MLLEVLSPWVMEGKGDGWEAEGGGTLQKGQFVLPPHPSPPLLSSPFSLLLLLFLLFPLLSAVVGLKKNGLMDEGGCVVVLRGGGFRENRMFRAIVDGYRVSSVSVKCTLWSCDTP